MKEQKPAFELQIDGKWFRIWAGGEVDVIYEKGQARPEIGIKINRIPALLQARDRCERVVIREGSK